MRKKMKRLGAFLLAMAMVLAMNVTAFAARNGYEVTYGTQDDIGTITVYGIDDEGDDLAVYAYPIILATYDDNGNFSGYESLYTSIFLITATGDEYTVSTSTDTDGTATTVYGYSGTTDDDGNVLVPSILQKTVVTDLSGNSTTTYAYVFTEDILDQIRNLTADDENDNVFSYASSSDTSYGTALSNVEKDNYQYYKLEEKSSETGYTADVAIGSYLVIIKNAEAVAYNVAVVSTYYTNADGISNGVSDDGVDMIKDGEAWVKEVEPEVSKTITAVSDEETDEDTLGTTANIGDVVEYTVTVTDIPYYGGDNPTFSLTDTLSSGLTLLPGTYTDDGNVTIHGDIVVKVLTGTDEDDDGNTTYIYRTLTEGTDYTITITEADGNDVTKSADADLAGATVIISFVIESDDEDSNGYTLNEYEGMSLLITYTAQLNDDATQNQNSNNNSVVLDYTVDSTSEGGETSKETKTCVYTFDINGYLFDDVNSDNDGETNYGATGSITYGILTKTGESYYVDSLTGEVIDDDDVEDYSEENGSKAVETNALSGAVFTLYTNENCTTVYKNGDSDGNSSNFAGIVTSDANGKLTITGLAAGTYYLKETTAPEGYTLNTNVYKIVIEAEIDEDTGELLSWSISIYVKGAGETEWSPAGSTSFSVSQTTLDHDGVSETDTDDGSTAETVTITMTTDGNDNESVEFTLTDLDETDLSNKVCTYKAVYSYTYTDDDENEITMTYEATAVKTVTTTVDDEGNEATATTWTVTVVSAAVSETSIANTQIIALPSTGGMGTALFTILGCLIMVSAAVLFMVYRRRIRR